MNRPAEPDLAGLSADDRVVWTEDVLRFGDTDANGHVNNAVFAVFSESGRVHLLNLVLAPYHDPGTAFVIAQLAIAFRAELHYPGRVRCGTWISALGRTSATFRQVLLDRAGKLVATSEAVVVALDEGSRRPVPLGPSLRAAMARLLRQPEASRDGPRSDAVAPSAS